MPGNMTEEEADEARKRAAAERYEAAIKDSWEAEKENNNLNRQNELSDREKQAREDCRQAWGGGRAGDEKVAEIDSKMDDWKREEVRKEIAEKEKQSAEKQAEEQRRR